MVSIIIPVYNVEKTLTACVDSILDQTYTDYELILVDDGSTDQSGGMCDAIREKCHSQNRLCTVIHQRNGGVSRARNCGMEHASGEFFIFIDSDDVIEPCYLEDLIQAQKSHPELGHVLCGFRCTSHVHDYILTDREQLTVVDRKDYMLLFDHILIQSPWLALYSTETVRNHQIKMREDLSLAEDILFNLSYLDALEHTAIGVVNKPNYIYQNEDQDSLYRRYRQDLLSINELVNGTIRNYLTKWGVTDSASWERYYNAVFFKYLNILENTFHSQNPMTTAEKIAYNDDVLRKEPFQEALRKMTCHLSPALLRAYQSGDYRKVMNAERMQRAKQTIAGLLR